jgi:membrane protein
MAEGIFDRLEASAGRSRLRLRGVNLPLLVVSVVRRFLDVRVMGLASEMTYFALLSIFPLIGALGAGLGFLERIAGQQTVVEAEATIISALGAVFATDVTQEVFVPMVQGLLQQERAGFAIGSFLITLLLAGRIFRAAIHTLDVAYRVEEWRGTVSLWALGFLFSLGAIVMGVVVLAMVVIGPLLGVGRVLAGWIGVGPQAEILWRVALWPAVFLVCAAYLAALYRFGPNARNSWRQTFPGAVFGVIGILLVSIGFQMYLGIVGVDAPEVAEADAAVILAGQVIGAVLASLLWLWLSSMVILTGGVLNAEIIRLREGLPPERVPEPPDTLDPDPDDVDPSAVAGDRPTADPKPKTSET